MEKTKQEINDFDINRPWLTLDDWQKEYIFDKEDQDNFLLTGRQVGKTTAMSIRAVELCVNHFKKGEFVLINSITEKQAYHMLAKSLAYAEANHEKKINYKKDEKPTKHRIMFKNGTGILCYAAGETGEGLRGFTIKKLMPDEGSRMSEEYFISVLPMMSVVRGTMDIASTPAGRLHKDGSEKFFYKCSKDDKFKKYYVSAEDCKRHTKEFLAEAKKRLSRLAYAQEYLAIFTDALRQIFPEDLLKKYCVLKRRTEFFKGDYYLGVDIAGFGDDECTFEIFQRLGNSIEQRENIILKRQLTTDTTRKILELNLRWLFKKIGIDDGGLGFGVYSELIGNLNIKRKVIPLNNASRIAGIDNKKKKLLKEEMYYNFLTLLEQGRIKLLDDDEVKASLSSMQVDEDEKIFGSYSHIAEGIVRAVWCAEKEKGLNIFVRSF